VLYAIGVLAFALMMVPGAVAWLAFATIAKVE
jgi:hypothetical protein